MRKGFIVIAISAMGIEKIKVIQGQREKDNETLHLFERIQPMIKKMGKVANHGKGENEAHN